MREPLDCTKWSLSVTPKQALAFVRKHGIVLEAGRGNVPLLAEAIAGEHIRGSWWSHPKSHEIFALTRAVREAEEVLVCRLIGGKVTFVHRRLWPALVRLARLLPKERLAQVQEVHTESGRHVTRETPYPRRVPADVRKAAGTLQEEAAREQIGCEALRAFSPTSGCT
jgi:hypothetical protein